MIVNVEVSKLNHTWIFDLDGVLTIHNSHLTGEDQVLHGVKDFWNQIPIDDFIIIMSAREESYRSSIIDFLNINNLRFNVLILGLPFGERILFNDRKPSGMRTALAINVDRNVGLSNIYIKINEQL